MSSFQLKLWAFCDARSERISLGVASPDRSKSMTREVVMGRVLIFSLYWGVWKGTRMRIVAGGTPESLHSKDVTEDAINDYLAKNPTDEAAKQVLTDQPRETNKRPASKSPEILLTLHNGVYQMLGEPL